MKANFYLLLLLCLCCPAFVLAQQKIGGNPGVADPNAYLHLGDSATSNKGLLMPRVVLKATNDPAPLTAHKAGMYVYNVAVDTAGKAEKGVLPGMYYNNGSLWVKVSNTDASIFIYGGPIASTPTIPCNATTNRSSIFVDIAPMLSDGITPNANYGKQWICNGTSWEVYTSPSGQTEWFRYNTTIDAGGDKSGSIYRTGNVAVGIKQGATGPGSVVLGGLNDTAKGTYSAVIGGQGNIASASESGVVGGFNNAAIHSRSFVGGGQYDTAAGIFSAVIGGTLNKVIGGNAGVFAGANNVAHLGYTVVVGGLFNEVNSQASAVVGGYKNNANGTQSGVLSGAKNTTVGSYSAVVAGENNTAGGKDAGTVAGFGNGAMGEGSFVGGGYRDSAIGTRSAVIGGIDNAARAENSVVLGGSKNLVTGNHSIAIGGNNLRNVFTGSVMMGDNSNIANVYNVVANSYTGMFNGGYRFLTNRTSQSRGVMIDASANLYPGVTNSSSLGTSTLKWSVLHATNGTINTSDIRLKKNIKPLAYGLKDVLKIEPISYSWKDDNTGKTKVGVSAQQLQTVIPEVVNIGDDAQQTLGVNYAELVPVLVNAIKELKGITDKQQTQIEELKAKVKALENK